ncbi:WD40-repeat-containing domain protein [Gigaspora rosea]|uniref:WD40-repeat-containing domain protein n=1 Tax=Gigaspora rosea TaxID=44941 RepID=A0A397UDF3_9GLOM|nr:WD40-repeat-containing domain protein [Gigaspora rosea]
MPSNLLVSASADVKVWDLQTSTESIKLKGKASTSSAPEQLFGTEVTSFAPVDLSTAVNAVRWSHDSQLLAVAGNEGNLTIHDSQGKLLETIPLNDEGSGIPDLNAVRFANKSRYVMYGGSDKIVNIWDRKESMFTEPLKGHRSTITCIDLNVDETIVASSNKNGQILVHNRQKSNTCDNLTVLTKQSINVLEYSFFKRGLLAAGGEDGSLRLWDTCVSSTALQTFENAHYSEIKGIAFSSFNSHLMCSGGLDKRIVLYDVGKKTTMKTIHTDTPLTTLGFKADSVTVVAGTLQGNILVYDLRSANKPMCTLYGHEPHPVKCLHCQEKDRSTDRRNTIVKKQSHIRTSSRGSTPPTSSRFSKPSPSPQTPNEIKEKKDFMDMFSPIKDVQVDDTIQNTSEKVSIDKPITQTPPQLMEIVPSPEKMTIDKPISQTPLQLTEMVASSEKVTIDKPITQISRQLTEMAASSEKMTIDKITQIPRQLTEMVATPEKMTIDKPITQTPRQLTEMVASSEKMTIDKPMTQTPRQLTEMVASSEKMTIDKPITPPQLTEMVASSEKADSLLSSPSLNAAMEMTTDFQLQVIRNAVDECLQEFRTSLRNDVQNMHLELLRQFHIQKTEMEMMFLKYCGETLSLREEIEQLREENQRLKMKF